MRSCDEAYCIGGAEPRQSYLKIERLIATARKARAECIHPGYGFLSENADFAEAAKKPASSSSGRRRRRSAPWG